MNEASTERRPCRLKLRILGQGCARLCVRVDLEAELDRAAVITHGNLAGCVDAEVGSPCLLGKLEDTLLHGGGSIVCPCDWPPATSGSDCTVICRARIAFIGFMAECSTTSPRE